PRMASAPLSYLSAPERWLLRELVGLPQRRLRAALAEVEIAGVRRSATALIVAVSYE
ncbi:MAG: hypothetical protein H6741_10910, partial [Alphaproteobacteria bacterium]|nr:hypothetical protein [Alphaproteobacteria bacterium]